MIEIVVPSKKAVVGTLDVADGAEVNFAAGGKSSAYEQSAETGSVTFTQVEADQHIAGSVTASYAKGEHIDGAFEATFCPGGQGY